MTCLAPLRLAAIAFFAAFSLTLPLHAQDSELSAGELRLKPEVGLSVPSASPAPSASPSPVVALPRPVSPPEARAPSMVNTGLPSTVLAALQRAQVPASALSALVLPISGEGAERIRHRAEVPINPASVMKLVTTYAAMDLLGPDFTWSTRFATDGVVDPLHQAWQHRVLQGRGPDLLYRPLPPMDESRHETCVTTGHRSVAAVAGKSYMPA